MAVTPDEPDDELSEYEKLQVVAVSALFATGVWQYRLSEDLNVVIDYRDRLNQHGAPHG